MDVGIFRLLFGNRSIGFMNFSKSQRCLILFPMPNCLSSLYHLQFECVTLKMSLKYMKKGLTSLRRKIQV